MLPLLRDNCATTGYREFDAAQFQQAGKVCGKVQAQLAKPSRERVYQHIFEDPCPAERDRAVPQPLTSRGFF
jgi:hypothetical protein